MIDAELNRLPISSMSLDVDYVVGALVIDNKGRIFVQRRTPNRKLFPGCWDIVGGHVEVGETLEEALRREIQEETGWVLFEVGSLVKEFHWQAEENGVLKKKIEFDFIAKVNGDLNNPQVEQGKHDKYYWLTSGEVAMLQDERNPDDTFIYDVVKEAFRILAASEKI
ncbi:MAG: NUDIX domain-containing protein [Prevotellaceae bacterium]|jgi:8-oxo-dGTP pyrophosphatase MutT (NUDIX family)|nr:NUDIX domain-containing protein [Prevotellaceae bacterium]